jgi:hypothetical protein
MTKVYDGKLSCATQNVVELLESSPQEVKVHCAGDSTLFKDPIVIGRSQIERALSEPEAV